MSPKEEAHVFAEPKLEDLAEAAHIYDLIRAMRRGTKPEEDKQLGQAFEERMGRVVGELRQTLAGPLPAHVKSATILRSKQSLLDPSFEKLIEMCGTKRSLPVWRSVRRGYNDVVSDLAHILQHTITATDPESEQTKKQLESARAEIAAMKLSMENAQNELQASEKEKAELKRRADQDRQDREEMAAQLRSVEEENKGYLATIIKRSKEAGNASPSRREKEGEKPSPETASPVEKPQMVYHTEQPKKSPVMLRQKRV